MDIMVMVLDMVTTHFMMAIIPIHIMLVSTILGDTITVHLFIHTAIIMDTMDIVVFLTDMDIMAIHTMEITTILITITAIIHIITIINDTITTGNVIPILLQIEVEKIAEQQAALEEVQLQQITLVLIQIEELQPMEPQEEALPLVQILLQIRPIVY